jgi:hypothetical protein
MEPMPNNGTLRLPLKVVGLHNDEIVLEQPEESVPISTGDNLTTDIVLTTNRLTESMVVDPAPTSKTEDIATGVMSILPITTSSAAAKPTPSIGVDPAQGEPSTPTQPAQPGKPDDQQQPDAPEEHEQPNGDASKGKGWWDSFKETYDWVKDKFNGLIDKVTDAVSSS